MTSTTRWPLALAAALLALCAWAAPGHADDDALLGELTPEETAHVLTLIEQLGDANYHVRERATADLKALGLRAAPLLREHIESPDMEVRMRIETILDDMPSRIYVATWLTQEPELDGRIADDPAWRGVPAQRERFMLLRTGGEPSRKTSFRIGYTREAIFVAVECTEPQPKEIKAGLKDGDRLFDDDSIELFLHPSGSDRYYQLVANASGARWNGVGLRPELELRNWHAAARIDGDSWTLEMKVPFAALELGRGATQAPWRFNICRNIRAAANELCTWSDVNESYHEPQNFARLVFAPPADADEDAPAER